MVLRLQTLPYASPLCRTFERLSSEVWATLADAHSLELSYGEESLTEMLLLELKRAHPNEIVVIPFNRRQESRNGADWAWWFEGEQWLGMRVQAKKLHLSGRYEALADKVGKSKTKLQVDVLLAQAKRDNLFPMYCFYNFWDMQADPLTNFPFNCRTFTPSAHRVGCTLAPAEHVKLRAIDQGKVDLASVGQVSFPWVCLVCCPGGSETGNDLASKVIASLGIQEPAAVPRQEGTPRRRRRVVPALVETPPRYVRAALDGRMADGDLPEGVSGVVVFKDVPREGGR